MTTAADHDTLPPGDTPPSAEPIFTELTAVPHWPSGDDDTTLDPPEARREREEPPSPPHRPLPRGARAGDYVVDRLLAQGGFSFVYRATHAERGTPVALKVLHADLASHLDAVLRFEREIEVIRRLDHPNVVRILEHGRLDGGHPFYAMELLEGSSLDEHLRARGSVSPADALALLEPLCSALEAVHRCGVVHRDIKASNVFVSEEHGRRRVVLLDFGVAKLLGAPGPALTSSRHILGTPAYISPEQLVGGPIDLRADVYALGILTYRMLVGAPPFAEGSYEMLRQMHLYVHPPRPSAQARIKPAFDAVVLRALDKDREGRHPTIAAFLSDFRAAVEASHGARASPSGGLVRRALAAYAEVHVDASHLEEPDDALLADLEVVLPFIAAELTNAGLMSAAETGTSVLFTARRPDEPASDVASRRRLVDAALSIDQRLRARAGRDPRIHVRLCLHAGELLDAGEAAPMAGKLLEVAAWVPDEVEDGVFASPEVLAELALSTMDVVGPLVRVSTPPA
ncbi:serine/threonine-protein kinase [Sorangium sp. So ce1335]|uniref:serine/threonine-protein kinase n=1 Tax=Sorangium sp. So ce1335 TaxID=3133335 RepID=UPI003F64682F